MKKILIGLAILLNINVQAKPILPDEQFPDPARTYVPKKDVGWNKYLAKSLYGTKKIVLTYDDGPHGTRTPKLLKMFNEYREKGLDVSATFFILPSAINDSNISIVKQILKDGHILASHDWNHENNNTESKEKFKSDLKKSLLKLEQIEDLSGIEQNEVYFRFPYGAYGTNPNYHHLNVFKELSKEMFDENCINFVFWDIDTADWVSSMTPKMIAQNIISSIEGGTAYRHKKVGSTYVPEPYKITQPSNGGVVLMHDIHERTIEATRIFLDYALNNDIQIVPLSEVEEYSFSNVQCSLKK